MIKIQYNKTYLIQINKDLAIRNNALPVLKSKEAALRAETKRIRSQIEALDKKIKDMLASIESQMRLWGEFPKLVSLKKIEFKRQKIASVSVQVVDKLVFQTESFCLFAYPAWFLQGIEIIKQVIQLKVERINTEHILESIEHARRKTTQKVNLYEKVQIPFFEEAMRRIKRFLEDEENLSKSSQKVIKKRMELVA